MIKILDGFPFNLEELRSDVQLYLRQNLKQKISWTEYEEYKRDISHLCGYDSPTEKYDQKLYDKAIRIISSLDIH